MLEISFRANAQTRGALIVDQASVREVTRVEPASISLTQWFEPERERVEGFIERTFAAFYGAIIDRHYPNLISVHAEGGEVIAAAGFRVAADDRLFVESYLSAPIETVIAQHYGVAQRRTGIVEIGNLASTGRGGSVFLFLALATLLHRNGFTYAVATATEALRRSFGHFGFECLDLSDARAEALPDRGALWGSYYSSNPRVLAGRIAPACEKLGGFLCRNQITDLDEMFAIFHPRAEGEA